MGKEIHISNEIKIRKTIFWTLGNFINDLNMNKYWDVWSMTSYFDFLKAIVAWILCISEDLFIYITYNYANKLLIFVSYGDMFAFQRSERSSFASLWDRSQSWSRTLTCAREYCQTSEGSQARPACGNSLQKVRSFATNLAVDKILVKLFPMSGNQLRIIPQSTK